MATLQKITPCLWFNLNAEDAVDYYISIFPNSKKGRVSHYGKEGFEIHHVPEGTVLTIEFSLEGQEFLALNGGPQFKFTEAVSFIIHCETQDEIDHYWNKLTNGGDPAAQACGWLKDKFGLSWQVVPAALADWTMGPQEKTSRMMSALLQMEKLDMKVLQKAYDGDSI